jgi:hypothetical protein
MVLYLHCALQVRLSVANSGAKQSNLFHSLLNLASRFVRMVFQSFSVLTLGISRLENQ